MSDDTADTADTERLLLEWNNSIETLRMQRAKVTAAARLFLEGSVTREELTRQVDLEAFAEKEMNAAFKAYQASYS